MATEVLVATMKESRDRLSGLPDDLLLTILNFLPLKSALTTAVLCKRWRWLWTQLSDIELSLNTDFSNHKDKFYTIVDNLLPKFTSPTIRRFSLNLGFSDDDNPFDDTERKLSQLCSWFDWACHRKAGLQELTFRIPNVFPKTLLGVLQSPSLVILELRPWSLCFHRDYGARNNNNNNNKENVVFDLPNLKIFMVGLYPWNPEVLEKLVSSSPLLEDLFLSDPYDLKRLARSDGDYHNLNLSSRSIRRLHMFFQHPIKVVLNTTNLEYLAVNVFKYKSLPNHQVSFVGNPPPALRAYSISLSNFKLDNLFLMPSNLGSVISNVTSLTTPGADALLAATTFRQLTRLKFMVPSAFLGALTSLEFLHQCPALEVLTFDFTYCWNLIDQHWGIPALTPQCLVTTVKRVEIIECSLLDSIEIALLCLLNYLIGSSKALEVLRINLDGLFSGGSCSEIELRLIKEVFKAPRSSPFCQIEFDGLHHRVFGKLDQGLSYSLQTYN